jgi:hypothetical protein
MEHVRRILLEAHTDNYGYITEKIQAYKFILSTKEIILFLFNLVKWA